VHLKYYYQGIEAYAADNYERADYFASTALIHDKKFKSGYLLRASCGKKLGKEDDFKKNLDIVLNDKKESTEKAFALGIAGRCDESIAMLEQIVKENNSSGNYFNLASLYSMCNNTSKSLENIELAFKNGFNSPFFIFVAEEIDPIRNMPEFNELLKKYKIEKTELVIAYELVKEEKALSKAIENGTLAGYDSFLVRYPNSSNRDLINYYKNELNDWNRLNKESYFDMEEFTRNFPDGKYIEQANVFLNEGLWKEASRDSNMLLLQSYITRFPEGSHIVQANNILDDLLWQSILQDLSIEKVEQYIKSYPNGKHIIEATTFYDNLFWGENRNTAENYIEKLKEILGATSFEGQSVIIENPTANLDRILARKLIVKGKDFRFPKITATNSKNGYIVKVHLGYLMDILVYPLEKAGFLYAHKTTFTEDYYQLSSKLRPFIFSGNSLYCEFEMARLKSIEVTGISGDEYKKAVEYTVIWEPNELGKLLIPISYFTRNLTQHFKLYDDGWRMVD